MKQYPPKTEKKKRGIRIPLLIRITILLVIAGLLGFLVVEILSRKSRMDLAVEKGGDKTLYGCIMANQLLNMVDRSDILVDNHRLPFLRRRPRYTFPIESIQMPPNLIFSDLIL